MVAFILDILALEPILGLVSISFSKIAEVLICDASTNGCIFLSSPFLTHSFLLAGRGFGRGRFPSHRAGFQGGRGFVPRGRGRGRFPFAAENDFETSYSEFRGGWRPFGPRGC